MNKTALTHYRARQDVIVYLTDKTEVLFEGGVVYQNFYPRDATNESYVFFHPGHGKNVVIEPEKRKKFQEVIVIRSLECIAPNDELEVEVGQSFRISEEDAESYTVTLPFDDGEGNIVERDALFTKQPDLEGYSYANWFKVVETVIPAED